MHAQSQYLNRFHWVRTFHELLIVLIFHLHFLVAEYSAVISNTFRPTWRIGRALMPLFYCPFLVASKDRKSWNESWCIVLGVYAACVCVPIMATVKRRCDTLACRWSRNQWKLGRRTNKKIELENSNSRHFSRILFGLAASTTAAVVNAMPKQQTKPVSLSLFSSILISIRNNCLDACRRTWIPWISINILEIVFRK